MVPETGEGILLKQMKKTGGEAGKSLCLRERMKRMRAYGEREHMENMYWMTILFPETTGKR